MGVCWSWVRGVGHMAKKPVSGGGHTPLATAWEVWEVSESLVTVDTEGAVVSERPSPLARVGVPTSADTLAPVRAATDRRRRRGARQRRPLSRWRIALRAALSVALCVATGLVVALGYQQNVVARYLPGIAGVSGVRHAMATPTTLPTATATPTATPTVTPALVPVAVTLNNTGCSGAPSTPESWAVSTGNYSPAGQPAPNEVALTFDDGPSPSSTPPILAVLEQTHTPATFFVIGSSAAAAPYLLQREARDGFVIGVHTWSHPMMTTLTPDQRQYQFTATVQTIHNAIGSDHCVWLWRPPYGDYNAAVVAQARSDGLTTIMWDVDPQDWTRPGTQTIVDRVLAGAHPGAIIIMHDGPALRDQTAAALPQIIAGLAARGLTPVTLPRLLADGHYPGFGH